METKTYFFKLVLKYWKEIFTAIMKGKQCYIFISELKFFRILKNMRNVLMSILLWNINGSVMRMQQRKEITGAELWTYCLLCIDLYIYISLKRYLLYIVIHIQYC